MEAALNGRAWRDLILPVLLAGALAAPFCFAPIRETDAGWHLALGRIVAASGIPFRNTLSWTYPDQPWYATSWLFDWLAYESILPGVVGLQLFLFILLLLTLTLVGLAGRQLHPLGAWLTPGLALLLLPRITARPHLASWVILAAVLALGAIGWSRGWAWRAAAIPVIALGSNLHAGAVFPAAALGCFCLEAGLQTRAWRRELLLGTLGVLALLANPGGLFNLRYLIDHLTVREVVPLGEFESPTFARAPTFYIVGMFALVVAGLRWRERPVLLLMNVMFFGLGLYALRLVYEAEIVATFTLAGGLGLLHRVRPRLEVGALAVGILALLLARQRYLSAAEIGSHFDARTLPVHAAEFIRTEHLDGRMFNAFRDGGYLSWAAPELKVFQDARVQAYPHAFFAELMQASKSSVRFQASLREKNVEWAIASRVKEDLAGYRLLGGADWALVYWDAASEVYVRRDVARLQPLVAQLELRAYRPELSLDETRSWSRAQVELLDTEAAREQRWDPTSIQAAVTRCFAQRRLGRATAGETCVAAAGLTSDDATLQQLERIARIPPI